jgi:hypothetical protein
MSALVVSVFPRMSAHGASALVSLDPMTFEPLAIRRFERAEYLCHPERSAARLIQHCRGIASYKNALMVSMFNAVRIYDVLDARRLLLAPRAQLSHPAAVDLHGLNIGPGHIAASSTGTDSIVSWSLHDCRTHVIALGKHSESSSTDLRYPAQIALDAGFDDWRLALPTGLHVNDSCSLADGSTVVCSLRKIWHIKGHQLRIIREDDRALFHDGRLMPDGRLVFSDGAAGELLMLDPSSREVERVPVACPREWFVRGLATFGSTAVVLRSDRGETQQRSPSADRPWRTTGRPGKFAVSLVDLATGRVTCERTIETDGLDDGVVAYSVAATNDHLGL